MGEGRGEEGEAYGEVRNGGHRWVYKLVQTNSVVKTSGVRELLNRSAGEWSCGIFGSLSVDHAPTFGELISRSRC
ncbi:hypothetical protein GCM10023335_90100 [Streptomyces siamensis]|uniref:Uncharacterized protein n=1 Tax=Streptomyces siamensis TaxID=1274986 RepID=A0ABP9JRP7_9ACTN